ncbi:MAG TPA: TraB/GumN family protein [Gammaproteobacteria bacterium]|nr:TraB/GumN family protein [Gammaproteobacteria bacterium]
MNGRAWLALLAATLPAGLASGDPAAWRVSGKNGGEVVLLGSMHVLRPSDHPLPPTVDALVDGADGIVMEIDLDDVGATEQQRIVFAAMLPQGTVLADVLDEDVYAEVELEMRELGVDLKQLEQFEPWFLAITALDLGMRKIGFQAERGVEQYVLGRARAAGKEIVGLETLAFQIGLFDALPREQQQAMLEQTLAELDEGAAVLGEMVAAWRAGELESLSAELLDEFDAFPGLYETLVTKRNTAWVAPLERMLTDGRRHLVVVGALHLVGPDSVIELLERRGHDVERLH